MKGIIKDENVKKKLMLVCPFKDNQTGLYIRNAFVQNMCPVAPFDLREELLLGVDYMNDKLINDVQRLKPDFVLIAKGIGITEDTIREMKKFTKVIYWMFDHTLGGQPIQNNFEYVRAIQQADTYYTVVKGDVESLKKIGINAKWLPEAASPQFNYPVSINYLEEKKYGADISFCGTIGTRHYHQDRLPFLASILTAGYSLIIYGAIEDETLVPDKLKNCHAGRIAINDFHNIVVNAAKINIGRSGWPDIDMAMSARTYRIMASGGFHLTNNTKGIEKMFTSGKHFDTYTSTLDCLSKIKYWLEHEKERKKVAKAGMNEVIKNHTFHHRIEQILKDIK